MARLLLVQCLIQKREDLLTTLKNSIEELDTQEKCIANDPVRVINRCQVIITEMKRMHQEIMPKSNLNGDLEGLRDGHRRCGMSASHDKGYGGGVLSPLVR